MNSLYQCFIWLPQKGSRVPPVVFVPQWNYRLTIHFMILYIFHFMFQSLWIIQCETTLIFNYWFLLRYLKLPIILFNLWDIKVSLLIVNMCFLSAFMVLATDYVLASCHKMCTSVRHDTMSSDKQSQKHSLSC